ncbi:MAG: penicillin-binding protein 1A [Longimicrobiaceae bacterium]
MNLSASENTFWRAARARLRSAWNHPRERWTVVALAVVVLLAGSAGGLMGAWANACAGSCPTAAQIADFSPRQASQVLDSKGRLLGSFYRERRTLVPLRSLPRYVPLAFVAIEDQRFFHHKGVDPKRMVGAIRDNILEGFGASGGSTITMQLARNLFPEQLPAGEKTIRRKLAEVKLALEMERRFSKAQILELYLNHIYLESGAYGVEAAARTYFDKPAAQLTYLEAATLAALPKAPSYYSPRNNPDAALRRRNLVLRAMAANDVIPREKLDAALRAPLVLAPPSGAIRAPYFVERVRAALEERFGELLYTGGLRIHTSLDPELQRVAERSLEQQLERIEQGTFGEFPHPTYAAYTERLGDDKPDGNTPYLQGLAVVLDPGTGKVLAMVGGRDFRQSQFNRATQALRQPGSAFKPFVYAAALEHGRSPNSTISDQPLSIRVGDEWWSPRNYGNRYAGSISLRSALRNSKNMAAIRLGRETGMAAVRDVAKRSGIETRIPGYPSAYIGAGAVRPLELIAAYAAFANGGYRVEPRYVTRVEDSSGRLLWEPPSHPRAAMDPAVAWLLTDMLREVVDRGTAYGARNPEVGGLSYDIPAAGKTGTTNDATDVWFVGYTPDLVAGVWLGMDQPRTILAKATGGGLAVPVWADIIGAAYSDRPAPESWPRPPGVVARRMSGRRAVTADCPWVGGTYTDLFVANAAPDPTCEPPERSVDPTPQLPGFPIQPGERRGVPRPDQYKNPPPSAPDESR